MRLTVTLTHRPILSGDCLPTVHPGDGARSFFFGHVRDLENSQKIQALVYEAYEPMAVKELERLAREIHRTHSVSEVHVLHRLGTVPVGEIAIALGVASPHRGESLEFIRLFMDRLKQDVPVWKTGSLP